MFTTWCLLIGGLLILIGLSDTFRSRLPFSSSAVYLVVGWLLGPQVLGYMDLRLPTDASIFEHLSEGAVLVSLFAVGLRLRVRLSDRLWLAPLMLATVAMVVTIGLMTLAGVALGLSVPLSLLIAAILAPTDPVLASDVQVHDIADRDSLRFSLTGEGGLNDGIAFPFVLLALGLLGHHPLGEHAARWWGVDLAWATLAGLALGALFGFAFSKAVVYLRREKETAFGMESFLTLGLIGLTYGSALVAEASGFLAVFAAGLAVRQFEHHENIRKRGVEAAEGAEVEKVANAAEDDPDQASAYIAKAVLEFSLDLEKLAELVVMLAVGSLLSASAFSAQSMAIALLLIFVARPVAVYLTTWRMRLSGTQRRLLAWFGTRGIGSMFYLAYAVARGVQGETMGPVADAVLVTIAISVLLHGSTATPVMGQYRSGRNA
jgi:sodium/hydrogen antiporter